MPIEVKSTDYLYISSSIISSNTVPNYICGTDYSGGTTEYNADALRELLDGYIGAVNTETTRRSIAQSLRGALGESTGAVQLNINGINAGTVDHLVFGGNYTVGMTNDYGTWFSNMESSSNEHTYVIPEYSSKVKKQSRLRRNLTPVIKTRANPLVSDTPAEMLALETLREVVTELEFRKYLKYGFVLVKGDSGATYQIYRNRSHVRVWVGGKVIEEICVYLRAVDGRTAPDTDKVVAFKAMIEADEEAFKAMGNRYRMAA